MNLEHDPKVDELSELIRHCNDSAGHHILWVDRDGEVRVTRVSNGQTAPGPGGADPGMQLRYETFEAGNEYVGPEAARDPDWMNQLFTTLVKEWPKAKGRPRVVAIDQS